MDEEEVVEASLYFASIGLIGIPGTIDNVDVENPMPLFMREGTTKSWLQLITFHTSDFMG